MAGPNKFYEEIGPEHMEQFQFISCGAFGNIYRVRHRDWGMNVAVKILNRNATFSQEELLREARAMDEARFPYILRLFGLYVNHVQPDNPSLGLVMEYMENGSLSTLWEWVSFVPWALRFRILHEVALGMNFLHNLHPPLLHLDLKPSNVLLDADLHVRVADFGLSKFKRGTTRLSNQAGEEEEGYGGTLEYLPPEAFGDLNYKPTLSTDVYSYGILMWSVLNGQEPYAYLPPGNMNSLIRRLIPQGQRPTLEALEGIGDVQKLENMIALMKSCWHNDKTKRTSFRECTQKTEDGYDSHKSQIMAAVHIVQNILFHRTSSSFKTTELTSIQARREASPSPHRSDEPERQKLSSSSSELEKKFETMHLVGSPSWQNEAVPPEASTPDPEGKLSSSHVLQRSRSVYNNQAEEVKTKELHYSEVKRRPRPNRNFLDGKPRPYSDTFLFPPYQPYPPGYLPFPQQPHGFQGHAGLTYPDHSLLPQFHGGSKYGGISIQGQNISGVQIGDCNNMHIQKKLERGSGKKQ